MNSLNFQHFSKENVEKLDQYDHFEIFTFFNNKSCSQNFVPHDLPQLDNIPKLEISNVDKIFLGKGEFGDVYLVKDTSNNREFALKIIPNNKASLNEIIILNQLDHENIVKFFGYNHDNENLNIFMEVLHEGSLFNLINKSHNLNEHVVRFLTSQILQGLKYLHDKNIIHRDIKSLNILLDKDLKLKIADFGCALNLNDEVPDPNHPMYTPIWTPPSVLNLELPQSKFTDIWSLGCVVIELLTGKLPWNEIISVNQDINPLQLISKQNNHPKIPSNLSDEGKEFLKLCFEMKTPLSVLINHPFVTQWDSTKIDIKNKENIINEETNSLFNEYSKIKTYDDSCEFNDNENDET